MIKKVGLLLLVLWGLSFSTVLHIIGTFYRHISEGIVFLFRAVRSLAAYRQLRPATGLFAFIISFMGIGAA